MIQSDCEGIVQSDIDSSCGSQRGVNQKKSKKKHKNSSKEERNIKKSSQSDNTKNYKNQPIGSHQQKTISSHKKQYINEQLLVDEIKRIIRTTSLKQISLNFNFDRSLLIYFRRPEKLIHGEIDQIYHQLYQFYRYIRIIENMYHLSQELEQLEFNKHDEVKIIVREQLIAKEIVKKFNKAKGMTIFYLGTFNQNLTQFPKIIQCQTINQLIPSLRKKGNLWAPQFTIINSTLSEDMQQKRAVLEWLLNLKLKQEDLEDFASFCEEIMFDTCTKDDVLADLTGVTGKDWILNYTKHSYFHKCINSGLRKLSDSSDLAYIRYPFKCLLNSLQDLYCEQQEEMFRKNSFTCYRGCKMQEQNIQFLKQNIQSYVQVEGFLSTTINRDQVQKFRQNVELVIEIEGNFGKDLLPACFGYLNNEQLSQFCQEQQVLFSPMNIFKIVQVSDHNRVSKISYNTFSYSYQVTQITLKLVNYKKIFEESINYFNLGVGERYLFSSMQNYERYRFMTQCQGTIFYKNQDNFSQVDLHNNRFQWLLASIEGILRKNDKPKTNIFHQRNKSVLSLSNFISTKKWNQQFSSLEISQKIMELQYKNKNSSLLFHIQDHLPGPQSFVQYPNHLVIASCRLQIIKMHILQGKLQEQELVDLKIQQICLLCMKGIYNEICSQVSKQYFQEALQLQENVLQTHFYNPKVLKCNITQLLICCLTLNSLFFKFTFLQEDDQDKWKMNLTGKNSKADILKILDSFFVDLRNFGMLSIFRSLIYDVYAEKKESNQKIYQDQQFLCIMGMIKITIYGFLQNFEKQLCLQLEKICYSCLNKINKDQIKQIYQELKDIWQYQIEARIGKAIKMLYLKDKKQTNIILKQISDKLLTQMDIIAKSPEKLQWSIKIYFKIGGICIENHDIQSAQQNIAKAKDLSLLVSGGKQIACQYGSLQQSSLQFIKGNYQSCIRIIKSLKDFYQKYFPNELINIYEQKMQDFYVNVLKQYTKFEKSLQKSTNLLILMSEYVFNLKGRKQNKFEGKSIPSKILTQQKALLQNLKSLFSSQLGSQQENCSLVAKYINIINYYISFRLFQKADNLTSSIQQFLFKFSPPQSRVNVWTQQLIIGFIKTNNCSSAFILQMQYKSNPKISSQLHISGLLSQIKEVTKALESLKEDQTNWSEIMIELPKIYSVLSHLLQKKCFEPIIFLLSSWYKSQYSIPYPFKLLIPMILDIFDESIFTQQKTKSQVEKIEEYLRRDISDSFSENSGYSSIKLTIFYVFTIFCIKKDVQYLEFGTLQQLLASQNIQFAKINGKNGQVNLKKVILTEWLQSQPYFIDKIFGQNESCKKKDDIIEQFTKRVKKIE